MHLILFDLHDSGFPISYFHSSKLQPVNAPVETFDDNAHSLALNNYLLIISCHIMKTHFVVANVDLHQIKIFGGPPRQ